MENVEILEKASLCYDGLILVDSIDALNYAMIFYYCNSINREELEEFKTMLLDPENRIKYQNADEALLGFCQLLEKRNKDTLFLKKILVIRGLALQNSIITQNVNSNEIKKTIQNNYGKYKISKLAAQYFNTQLYNTILELRFKKSMKVLEKNAICDLKSYTTITVSRKTYDALYPDVSYERRQKLFETDLRNFINSQIIFDICSFETSKESTFIKVI